METKHPEPIQPVLTEHLELSRQPSVDPIPCKLDDRECTARWIQACADCD